MKVIDLLNKIANGEEVPLKIKLEQGAFTLREDCGGNKWYGREYDHKDIFETINQNLEYVLLEEIELIEEDKPIEEFDLIEKINNDLNFANNYSKNNMKNNIKYVANKINELVDEVNKLKKERRMNNE